MNYYNEFDPSAAAWLRELIDAGHIPQGYVDDRSITEVTASDLAGFTQCHFFAGIGGWSYALKLAGVPANTELWTGSPPCQPFSVAGKQLGQLDERHLAPTFMRLVDQCRPPILFGEQVAAAISKHWLDDLFVELEEQGYACGSAVLPACGVGAPHKRDRLWFGASQLADSERQQCEERLSGLAKGNGKESSGSAIEPTRFRLLSVMADTNLQCESTAGDVAWASNTGGAKQVSRMANSNNNRQQPSARGSGGGESLCSRNNAGRCGSAGRVANAQSAGQPCRRAGPALTESCKNDRKAGYAGTSPTSGHWRNADWLLCRDEKWRPVEPGTFPLANGLPARVGRLRGYGNAIVPQVAAEFIKAFYGAVEDARK